MALWLPAVVPEQQRRQPPTAACDMVLMVAAAGVGTDDTDPRFCCLPQAYFGVFTFQTLTLLRSHLSDPYWHPVRNPVMIAIFGALGKPS